MPVPTSIATQYAAVLAEKLTERANTGWNTDLYPERKVIITVQSGQKFDKLMESIEGDKYSGSVHAFIVRATGELVKAAGINAPAKSRTHPSGLAVRFDLTDPEQYEAAVNSCKNYGYLYAN